MHHLQYADYIILLDKNGNIAEQGTPDVVSVTAGGIQAQDSEAITTSRPELEIPEDVLLELEILDDQEPAETRRAGDVRIYTYYAKTAGYWRTSIYLLACCAFVYGSIFPGECPPALGVEAEADSDLPPISRLAAVVDKRQRDPAKRPHRLLAWCLWRARGRHHDWVHHRRLVRGRAWFGSKGLTVCSVFNLAVLPTTARKFHELLLDTTMRYVSA